MIECHGGIKKTHLIEKQIKLMRRIVGASQAAKFLFKRKLWHGPVDERIGVKGRRRKTVFAMIILDIEPVHNELDLSTCHGYTYLFCKLTLATLGKWQHVFNLDDPRIIQISPMMRNAHGGKQPHPKPFAIFSCRPYTLV